MTPKRRKQAGWIIGILVVANIALYYYLNWGLITVKVHDAPLGKVIKSIEWQGWVKIYTNLDPNSKVSMYVDHVPLAEAMESLADNADTRPANAPPDGGGNFGGPPGAGAPPGAGGNFAGQPGAGGPPGAGAPPGAGGNFGGPPGAGAPPSAGGNFGGPPGAGTPPGAGGNFAGQPGAGGPPGTGGPRFGRGGRGGFGGFGGFGGMDGGAQWNLAFFVAPTSSQVKSEILSFEQDNRDDDTKIYNFPTPIQMISTDSDMPASDPRQQAWPGVKPDAAPATATTNTPADGTAQAPADNSATPATKNAQDYLRSFAESANVWIMAPGSWTPDVSSPPPANSSIVSAIKSFVSRLHGSVTEAIILRARWNGGRGGRGGGPGGFMAGDAGLDSMADRVRNSINGLPPDARADAQKQLDQEIAFYKDLQTAPPEQRFPRLIEHILDKAVDNFGNSRRSPEKRAQLYQRLVAARISTIGK